MQLHTIHALYAKTQSQVLSSGAPKSRARCLSAETGIPCSSWATYDSNTSVPLPPDERPSAATHQKRQCELCHMRHTLYSVVMWGRVVRACAYLPPSLPPTGPVTAPPPCQVCTACARTKLDGRMDSASVRNIQRRVSKTQRRCTKLQSGKL
jgi:hypothetical protein